MKFLVHTALSAALLGFCVLAPALSSRAATTIFSDDFTGIATSGLNADGWYFYNNNTTATDSVLRWTTLPDTTGNLSGTVMKNNNTSSANSAAIRQFSAVTLANVGDSISLSFDFYSGAAGTLQLSLIDSASTLSANTYGATNPLADANGYYFSQVFSASATRPSYKGFDAGALSALSTPAESTVIGDNLGHSLTLQLTLMAGGGVQISSSIDGTVYGSYTDATGSIYTTFNTLRIVTGGTGAAFDNVTLTTTAAVPEPSSLILGSFGLVAAWAGTRCLLKEGKPFPV